MFTGWNLKQNCTITNSAKTKKSHIIKKRTNNKVSFVEFILNSWQFKSWPRVLNRMMPDGLSLTMYRCTVLPCTECPQGHSIWKKYRPSNLHRFLWIKFHNRYLCPLSYVSNSRGAVCRLKKRKHHLKYINNNDSLSVKISNLMKQQEHCRIYRHSFLQRFKIWR